MLYLETEDVNAAIVKAVSVEAVAVDEIPSSSEMSSLAHTKVNWKETPTAHIFKADILGLKREEVKVEVEDRLILQTNEERRPIPGPAWLKWMSSCFNCLKHSHKK